MRKGIICIVIVMVMVICSAVSPAAAAFEQRSTSPWVRVTLLNQDPNPARAGDLATIRFKVENAGSEAVNNLEFELVKDYPFTVIDGDTKRTVSTLDAFQVGNKYVELKYMVKIDKDAVQGERQLQLNYRYGDREWDAISFPVSITSKQFAQIIFIDRAKLSPGKETDITFTINNIGSAPLQNLVFSWSEPNGKILPVYSGDTKYVKYLDVGQSADITFKVMADVNADPGLYQLNLNLRMESTTNISTSVISTKAGIFIGGETDFDVAFSESSAGQTSLSISNVGNNPAQSVSVKIPEQQNYRVSGTNSAIIGNLDKGDYTIVSFQIVSMGQGNFTGQRPGMQGMQLRNMTGTGPNTLQVAIDYTDTTGERRSVLKSLPIQFRSGDTTAVAATGTFARRQQSAGFIGSIWFYAAIAAVALGLFYGYRKVKSRKKIADHARRP